MVQPNTDFDYSGELVHDDLFLTKAAQDSILAKKGFSINDLEVMDRGRVLDIIETEVRGLTVLPIMFSPEDFEPDADDVIDEYPSHPFFVICTIEEAIPLLDSEIELLQECRAELVEEINAS